MQDTIETIKERSSLEKKDKLQRFLEKSIKISADSEKRTTATYDNLFFNTVEFFEGLSKCLNDITLNKRLELGVELLFITLEELGFDVEIEDAFLIYQLRDLGKFKIKDVKFREQMQALWKQNKEYELTDQEFSKTLKIIMKMGIINYRKGNLNLKSGITIHYKD